MQNLAPGDRTRGTESVYHIKSHIYASRIVLRQRRNTGAGTVDTAKF